MALVLEGGDRTTAARSCGMDRQTLRDWAHRYNREGLAGLRNRVSTGAPSRLTPAQKQELARIVEAGPDRDVHGVVRWRRVDLRDELKRRFGVELHQRSVGRILKAPGYRRLSARPAIPGRTQRRRGHSKKKKLLRHRRRAVSRRRPRQAG